MAAFLALTPVSGALLAVPLLGEELRAYHAIGILLAVGGVYLASREPAGPPRMLPIVRSADGATVASALDQSSTSASSLKEPKCHWYDGSSC